MGNMAASVIEGDDCLYVTVSDTGSGIKNVNRETIFSLFSMKNVSNQQINQNGMGLGLTVARMLCENMKGRIFISRCVEG